MKTFTALIWAYCRWLKPAKQIQMMDKARTPKAFIEFWRDRDSESIRIKAPPRWTPEDHLKQVEQDVTRMYRDNIHWTSLGQEEYPEQLAAITDPPLVLFYRGGLPENYEHCVGLVGTRKPLFEAKIAAFEFGKASADLGIHLVSGLAFGIDATGHAGLVWAEGRGTAVLGSGVGVVSPKSNRYLATSLLKYGGSLVSEFPPYSGGEKFQYVQRNRIISGLCKSLVVLDAPPGSGALHTLDFALNQGRDVYIHSTSLGKGERSKILEQHIQDGAQIIDSAKELVPCYRRNIDSLTI
jgi:DNA processing protein